MNHIGNLYGTKGGDNPLDPRFRAAGLTSRGPTTFHGDLMATQKPGTKLTIISGSLRGRRCVHEADVLTKSVDSPVPVPAFRVQLLNDEGEPDRSVIMGCHSVKVGWWT